MSPASGSKSLIIAGMHRSGTSLVAALLQSAGVHLGNELMPAKAGNNAKGFFENIDFVDFHEELLSSCGKDRFGWSLDDSITVPERFQGDADRLIARHARQPLWGFKDPRTTLFLDFWSQKLPDSIFLFVFRSPWEVIDSLYRRGDEIFQIDPGLAVRAWEKYNRNCLDFLNRHPERAFLASVDGVAADPAAFVNTVNKKFGLNLGTPDKQIIDTTLLKSDVSSSHRVSYIQNFFPLTFALFHELNSSADISSLQNLPDTPIPHGDFLLADWMKAHKAERDLKAVSDTLYDVRSELYHTKQKLEHFERSRVWKLRNAILKGE